MSGIEDAHNDLDRLSEQVGQFGESIIGVSNEERYASLAPRALHAGHLAAELAELLVGISTDLQEYDNALALYDEEGQKCVEIRDYAQEIIADSDGPLSRAPDEIKRMALFTAGALRPELEAYRRGFPDLASALQKAGEKLNKVGERLPKDVQKVEERAHQRIAEIQAQIRQGKASI